VTIGKASPYIDKTGRVIHDGHAVMHDCQLKYLKPQTDPHFTLLDIVEFDEFMIDNKDDKDGWGYGNYHASFIPMKTVDCSKITIVGEVVDEGLSDIQFYPEVINTILKGD